MGGVERGVGTLYKGAAILIPPSVPSETHPRSSRPPALFFVLVFFVFFCFRFFNGRRNPDVEVAVVGESFQAK